MLIQVEISETLYEFLNSLGQIPYNVPPVATIQPIFNSHS